MQTATNRHVTDDQLEAYALGCLEESEQDEVEEHLWECEQCQEALSAEEVFAQAMRTAGREWRRRSTAPGRLLLPMPAWAVSLAALLVLIGMWRLAQPPAAPAALVFLESTRGADRSLTPAGRPFALVLDLTDLPPLARYDVEIVDAAGQPVFQSRVAGGSNQVRASVPRGLPPGMYYVRLYAPPRDLLREYGLHVAEP